MGIREAIAVVRDVEPGGSGQTRRANAGVTMKYTWPESQGSVRAVMIVIE
jgi:hypothetical protein